MSFKATTQYEMISCFIRLRKYLGNYRSDRNMADDAYRVLPAVKNRVQCLPEKKEPLENCGFCVHCREFLVGGKWVTSPSLAYCTKCRVTEKVDLKKAEAVKCADRQGGGFHSITNIIS
jgi:hypothetical protein